MPVIGTTSEVRHTVGPHKVYTAASPAGPWTLQENLWCNSLDCVAGPDIDEASLEWEYGLLAGELRSMKDLDRQYVKIEVLKADDTVLFTWYGIIEVDDRSPGGTRTATVGHAAATPGLSAGDAIPHGTQNFTAYGLLRELERTVVRTSQVLDQAGNLMEIGRGLAFNRNDHGHFPERGNRSALGIGGYPGAVFSHEPNGQNVWSAYDAVLYLLEFHRPADWTGNPLVSWSIDAPGGVLDWLEASASTDGRNVKDILDDIIDRRRLLGYWVSGAEVGGFFECTLHIFTFNENPIPTGTGAVIPANIDAVSLDFETAFDIDYCSVSNNLAHVADRVIALGGFITSTFTMAYDTTHGLIRGWTGANQTAQLAGASGEAGYGGWTLDRKQQANQQARSAESLSRVFSHFVPPDTWAGETFDPLTSTLISCVPNADPAFLDFITATNTSSVYGIATYAEHKQTWIWKRHSFLDYLPIKNPDGDDAEFIRPFVCWRLEDAAPVTAGDKWAFGHKLSTAGEDKKDKDFDFSTRLYMLEHRPGIRIDVSSGVQQLIARDDWTAAVPADTRPDQDPAKAPSVSYREDTGGWMLATLAAECDHRVEVMVERSNPPPQIGVHLREMIIEVPGARLDLMAPYTVYDLDAAGRLLQSANGQILRDDRDWLRETAEAAGAWYFTKRQAISLKWMQLDPLSLEIGQLVTDIGARYRDPDINSVITGISYDFNEASTRIETAYADLDVAAVFGIG